MKYIFSIAFFAFCFNIESNAQNCKYDVDKSDPFSGKNIKSVSAPILGSWKITFIKNDNDLSVEIYILLSGHREDVVSAGDSMLIAVDGAKPVLFVASESFLPKHEVNGSVIKTWYQIKYAANAETLAKLNVGNIKAIRIFTGSSVQETEIPSKNAAKIKKAVNCITM